MNEDSKQLAQDSLKAANYPKTSSVAPKSKITPISLHCP